MDNKQCYSISFSANYDNPSSGTKMEIVFITVAMLKRDESVDEYCRELILFLFPKVPESRYPNTEPTGQEAIAHYNHRHSFLKISDEQYRHLCAVHEAGDGLLFEYSVE